MALKHILKHTETDIVFKCYITESNGGVVDLSIQNEMTKATQVYVAPTSVPNESGVDTNGLGGFFNYTGSRAMITDIWWGLKVGKQLDISRIVDPTGPILHGHYYLVNAGSHNYKDFSDRVYANRDLRLTFDGPGHCIIHLRKEGWAPKIETAYFGQYDNPNEVGS
jgi:hypothetical protein